MWEVPMRRMVPNSWRSDAPLATAQPDPNEQREIDRALLSRREREAEQDAKMERRIRIAMAAKEDSEGNCFYCGKRLEVETVVNDGVSTETKLHPMPYLDCKGPPMISSVPMALIREAAGLPKLPEIKPVRRPFGERDDD
jgi:hypothetical protein